MEADQGDLIWPYLIARLQRYLALEHWRSFWTLFAESHFVRSNIVWSWSCSAFEEVGPIALDCSLYLRTGLYIFVKARSTLLVIDFVCCTERLIHMVVRDQLIGGHRGG